MVNDLPFNETLKDGFYIRTFQSNLDNEDLKWHWDEEDRIVVCEHDTDWQIQIDEELPFRIERNKQYFIPEGVFHRIIKGTNDITFKVKKLNEKNNH